MSGYRDRSGFDPNAAWGEPGPPMRPYNWVQWTGVAFAMLGVLGYLAWAADRLGWISIGLDSPTGFISLPLIGVVLINSRREPVPGDQVEAVGRKRKRITIIAVVVAVLAAIIGFAAAYFSHGA